MEDSGTREVTGPPTRKDRELKKMRTIGSTSALTLAWALAFGCSPGDPAFDVGDDTDTGTDGDTDADTDADTDTGEDELPPELPAACTADSVGVPLSGAGDGRWPAAAAGTGGGLVAFAYDDLQGAAGFGVQSATCQAGVPPVLGAPQAALGGEGLSEKPALAVRGGAFGMAWLDTRWDADCQAANPDACRREVAFVELGADGLPAGGGEPLRLTVDEDPGGRPVIAATASGWLVAWARDQGSTGATVEVVSIGGAGQPGAVHAISGSGAAAAEQRPALATLGDQALVAWLTAGQDAIATRVVGADGAPAGEEVAAVEGTSCMRPRLAAGDGGYLLTYARPRGADLEIRALRLDTAGLPVGDEQRVTWTTTDTTVSHPAWSGSEWAVAWLSDRGNGASECQVSSCQPQVFVTVLDADGVPRAREVVLSEDQNFASEPELIWDGTGWLAVFELWRNLRKQIHWGHAFCD
jgi:hypothetical protein